MENKYVSNDGFLRTMIALFLIGIFVLGFCGLAFIIIPHADHCAVEPSHFEVIFQDENEFENLRVSTGTSFHSPDGTLLVDAEGQAWAVEGVELADDVNVLVMINNNNTTDNIYDDVVVGMYRIVQ